MSDILINVKLRVTFGNTTKSRVILNKNYIDKLIIRFTSQICWFRTLI